MTARLSGAREMKTNVLYYGDNLDILKNKEYFPDECVDLVYLDPPFNSKKDYNILFKENGGVESEAQIKAFTDSWHWTPKAQETYQDIIINGSLKIGKLMDMLNATLGHNDVMAYLVMMTARLVELHRVLKPTGSLYLHCDPTASHYLKLVLDQVFGPVNFRNEIVWKRTSAHNDSGVFGNAHDILFYYSKTNDFVSNKQYQTYNEEYLDSHYRFKDKKGRLYRTSDLTAKGLSGGGYSYEWHGVNGLWRCPIERMTEWETEGRIRYTKNGTPEYIRYLDEMPGMPTQDVWDDIPPINSQAKERLGYQTQKPQALLERIIEASSKKGDIVLDPFCGCGTAVVAAQKLKRKWIGIDVTHLAINLMRVRLKDNFKIKAEVIGEPVDLSGAKELASKPDKYQFQWWALGLVGARPAGEKKKGADKGIDGIISFLDDPTDKPKRAIVQVKSGHVHAKDIRELITVAGKEAMGIFITLEEPTRDMMEEAIAAGYYHSPIWNKDYAKIQILTIDELLHSKNPDMPPLEQTSVTFTKAPKIVEKHGRQMKLGEKHETYEV
jgi:site-specific DNA-methyltransferase (adenine-specific)